MYAAKAFDGRPQGQETASDSAYGSLELRVDSTEAPREIQSMRECGRRNVDIATDNHLRYNQDRHEIARSLVEAKRVVDEFRRQATDATWPMRVPFATSVKENRPSCPRTSTTADINATKEGHVSRPQMVKRACTTQISEVLHNEACSDSSASLSLSSEIDRSLQILQPEIMMAAHSENIIHTMNPKAVGEIMEQQFTKIESHLNKLHIRVDDTSSKVLVTGDLNAGKSTFCNALLRQNLLPTDQQPCTEVFCEVLDACNNNNVCEVHGVLHNRQYEIDDTSTYEPLRYDDLQNAVLLPEKFSALKVYVDDGRSLQDSLLRNGIVDISLIDAPGLNSDSMQTTAVYARQEEIDVVVFVVSAENHFTLSAKEFLWNAANEKAYLFIVVNRFDNIRDKDRCRRLILDQVSHLSPKTRTAADELVHFISATSVLDDSSENRDNGFADLELQLRNFVLNKRSQSKLAPAKNFVTKFWSDVKELAAYNIDSATESVQKLQTELREIEGKLNGLTQHNILAVEQVEKQIERTTESLRLQVKENLQNASFALATLDLNHKYSGLFECLNYAQAIRSEYLDYILSATIHSEMQCRNITATGVSSIREIASMHLDPSLYSLKPFNSKFMFSRKRDAIQRHLPVSLQPLDFIDMANFETVIGTSSVSAALMLYGGKTLGWTALLDTSLRALNSVGVTRTPKIIGCVALVSAVGLCTYVALQIPNALQKNIVKKVQSQMSATEYIDANARRITHECRKILSIPQNELRMAFALQVQDEQSTRMQIEKQLLNTAVTIEFFKRQSIVISREESRLSRVNV